jgi:hypothetical protein
LTDLVAKAVTSEEVDRYDAILVDEGQDFYLEWWRVLREALRPGGEMLLVADYTQDLFGRARNWTDEAMEGAGFSGPWSILSTSYRLPPELAIQAATFATDFLSQSENDGFVLPPLADQTTLNLYPCQFRWRNLAQAEDTVEVCVEEILRLLKRKEDLAIADVTFLTWSNDQGLAVSEALSARNIQVSHTCDESDIQAAKHAFYKGRGVVKVTTIHSYKGWETRAIVLLVPKYPGRDALTATYTGMTRVLRSTQGSLLTVVNSRDDLRDFGAGWPATP